MLIIGLALFSELKLLLLILVAYAYRVWNLIGQICYNCWITLWFSKLLLIYEIFSIFKLHMFLTFQLSFAEYLWDFIKRPILWRCSMIPWLLVSWQTLISLVISSQSGSNRISVFWPRKIVNLVLLINCSSFQNRIFYPRINFIRMKLWNYLRIDLSILIWLNLIIFSYTFFIDHVIRMILCLSIPIF